MPALVTTDTELPTGSLEILEKRGELLLALAADPADELSILIVDDRRMRNLNRSYRGKDRSTNVLSFPMTDEEEEDDGRAVGEDGVHEEDDDLPRLLGDIVISLDTARQEAAAAGTGLDDYLTVLLVHGFVHLLGYDHEVGEDEAKRMLAMEQKMLESLAASVDVKPLGSA